MKAPNQVNKINPRVFLVLFLFGLFLSAIRPNDYFYWAVHIFTPITLCLLLIITYHRFRFTDLTYLTILIYCGVILEGAHYGNANVPLFVILKELLHENYILFDKFSCFAQGFMVAAVFREILVRRRVIRSGMWQYLMVVSFAISISVFSEQFDWLVLEMIDHDFDFLVAAQNSTRDIFLNIFSALIGAVFMLIFLGKAQYKRIKSKSGQM